MIYINRSFFELYAIHGGTKGGAKVLADSVKFKARNNLATVV